MSRIPFPSAQPRGPQVELCAYCQRLVNVDELYECDLIGPLNGLRICIYHGSLGTLPGYLDLRGLETPLADAVLESVREEPYGAPVWWDANGAGYVQREDGVTPLLREDGYGGFLHES